MRSGRQGNPQGAAVIEVELPWGVVTVTATAAGVWAVDLPRPGEKPGEQARARHRLKGEGQAEGTDRRAREVAQAAARELEAYGRGELRSFTVPLDLQGVTEFQLAVLQACQGIKWGQTATYGDLARSAGSPQAARAVGQVMARNPVALLIPCHRVWGQGRQLTGFGGGLAMKKALLIHEGVLSDE